MKIKSAHLQFMHGKMNIIGLKKGNMNRLGYLKRKVSTFLTYNTVHE